MKKTIITLALLAALVAGYTFAQSVGDVSVRGFFRRANLNAARTDQINAIWEIIDAKKTNTTLVRLSITRTGTNDCVIVAEELVQVKLVEH